jgi:PRMT5 oligomerisation domain
MRPIDIPGDVGDDTVNYYYYLGLIGAKERITAFQSALRSCVRIGDVVVEIGAGLGTYSFFAARSGARRVYAIEKERVIQVAEELAVRNGLAERLTFLRANSTEIILPEKGDVLVLEDFSSLFLRRGLEELVRDALSRHLKADGIVIPQAVSLFVAPVGDAALWKGLLNLENDNYQLYGLDLGLLRQMMLESPHVRRIDPEALLAEPLAFKSIELKQPQRYLFDEVLSVKVTRSGTMYGLAGWFDLKVTNDLLLSNAPSNPESAWRQVFFPFSNPLEVKEGETVTLRLACARSSRTRDIWWTWQGSASSGLAHNCSFQGIPLRTSQLDTPANRGA